MKATSLAGAQARYGAIVNGRWADEAKWCLLMPAPAALKWINSATKGPVTHIYLNKDMLAALNLAFQNIIDRNLVDELKTFDGCFEIRDVRAEPGHPSCHSYGLAIDINAATNKLGEAPTMNPRLVTCFVDAGFDWGGNFHRKDGMHFSYAWESGAPKSSSSSAAVVDTAATAAESSSLA